MFSVIPYFGVIHDWIMSIFPQKMQALERFFSNKSYSRHFIEKCVTTHIEGYKKILRSWHNSLLYLILYILFSLIGISNFLESSCQSCLVYFLCFMSLSPGEILLRKNSMCHFGAGGWFCTNGGSYNMPHLLRNVLLRIGSVRYLGGLVWVCCV